MQTIVLKAKFMDNWQILILSVGYESNEWPLKSIEFKR